jgi:S-adenosylmethionine hydrolase
VPETRRSIVTLTTDFGTADHFVSSMKAAILDVYPDVQIVDITHEIPAHDIVSAAFTLREATRIFPNRTVHLAVVDPGVGTARRPIAVSADNQYFIGPDNGIFSQIYEADPDFHVYHITATHYMRENPHPTFHGRDIFAPSAAQLARGNDIENFGPPVEDPVKVEQAKPKVTADGQIKATVVHIDRFGNLVTGISQGALANLMKKLSKTQIKGTGKAAGATELHKTYGDVQKGSAVLLFNSSNHLELAANQGRACDLLGLKTGDLVELQLF